MKCVVELNVTKDVVISSVFPFSSLLIPFSVVVWSDIIALNDVVYFWLIHRIFTTDGTYLSLLWNPTWVSIAVHWAVICSLISVVFYSALKRGIEARDYLFLGVLLIVQIISPFFFTELFYSLFIKYIIPIPAQSILAILWLACIQRAHTRDSHDIRSNYGIERGFTT